MKPIIEVKSLSKAYTIGQLQRAAYGSLRDDLVRSLQRPFRIGRSDGVEREEIWALRDVSFDVQPGDIVGIIGRNGAGKSTLLKILSRIVNPTAGEAILRGRVASLLEVGTGFHQELSGRENVYLNGAILGLTRNEIRRKFDEIVAFAEVEQFLDTPVKFYSSGMYVRLAFAVAAHLEPDILIVDEVLAVGDAAFQRKSLGKMNSVAKAGRTILFVSHNAEAVASLCDRGIHLRAGQLFLAGTARDALDSYRSELEPALQDRGPARRAPVGAGGALVRRVAVENDAGVPVTRFAPDDLIALTLEAEIGEENLGRDLSVGFGIDTELGQRVFTVVSSWAETAIVASDRNLAIRCVIPQPRLAPRRYLVSASISARGITFDYAEHIAAFEVVTSHVILEPKRDESHGPVVVGCTFEQIDRYGSTQSPSVASGA
jgi:homopolymeric O-antigen transport system ATP-binding protein